MTRAHVDLVPDPALKVRAGEAAATDTPPRVPVASPSSCRISGCEITAARVHTGYCLGHHDAYLTRAYDLTRDLGRGSFDE